MAKNRKIFNLYFYRLKLQERSFHVGGDNHNGQRAQPADVQETKSESRIGDLMYRLRKEAGARSENVFQKIKKNIMFFNPTKFYEI